MIVILDTSVLQADSRFADPLWRYVGSRPAWWNMRVVVPWTVHQEVVENRRRVLNELQDGLASSIDKIKRKAALEVSRPQALQQLERAKRDCDGHVSARWDGYRIEVADPPDVDHRELVRRATQRIRPCDQDGDGYRDTLNWFTVLQVAATAGEDEKVLWVSKDHGDFADPSSTSPRVFHRHLREDLATYVPGRQVIYCETLAEALGHVVEEYRTHSDTDAGQKEVQALRVAELVKEALATLPDPDRLLNPVACGLPWNTRPGRGLLMAVEAVEPADVTSLTGQTLPFTAQFEATVRMVGYSRADGAMIPDPATEGEPFEKVLVASGTAHCDPDGHIITSVVIDAISATEDDPVAASNRDAMDRLAASLQVLAQNLTAMPKFPVLELGRHLHRQLEGQQYGVSPAVLEQLKLSLNDSWGSAFQSVISPALMSQLKAPGLIAGFGPILSEQLRASYPEGYSVDDEAGDLSEREDEQEG